MLLLTIVLAVALAGSLITLMISQAALVRARRQRDELKRELQRPRAHHVPTSRGARAVRAVMGSAVESAVRLREHGVSGLLMSSIEDLTHWALEDRNEIARLTAPDGSVTILFSDIEESTSLNEQLGDDDWVGLLGAHDTLVKGVVEHHRGHIVKSQGDGFMIAFSEPADAVRAGIEIQDVIGSGNHRKLRRTPIRVRVGIHCGTAIEKDGDFFGTNVARAARVAAQAEGGEILVSDEVRQALRDVDDIVLVDFREVELKGLPGLYRLWEVALI